MGLEGTASKTIIHLPPLIDTNDQRGAFFYIQKDLTYRLQLCAPSSQELKIRGKEKRIIKLMNFYFQNILINP